MRCFPRARTIVWCVTRGVVQSRVGSAAVLVQKNSLAALATDLITPASVSRLESQRGREEEASRTSWVGWNVTCATMPPRGRGGSINIHAEDIFKAFTLFDKNGDGFITRSEFVRILTRTGEGCTPLDEEQAINLWNDFLQDVGAAHGTHARPRPSTDPPRASQMPMATGR